MVAFNPDIPETQEPNYLRYSRPSNYAPVNKAAGEAIKGVGQVVGQTARAADSLVTEGIKSEVSKQAQDFSQQHIATLENRYNEVVLGQGSQQSLVPGNEGNVPKDIQALPGKVDAISAYKAKGGQVNAEYDAKLYGLAKDMRSKFPGYRDIIDREVSRASGAGMANPYAQQLLGGIQAAEAKAKEAHNADRTLMNRALELGLISGKEHSSWENGMTNSDHAKEQLGILGRQKTNLEMTGLAAKTASEVDTYATKKAEHGVDDYTHSSQTILVNKLLDAKGATNGVNWAKTKQEFEGGRQFTEEQRVQQEQSIELEVAQAKAADLKALSNSEVGRRLGPAMLAKRVEEAYAPMHDLLGIVKPSAYIREDAFGAATIMKARELDRKNQLDLLPATQVMKTLKDMEADNPGAFKDIFQNNPDIHNMGTQAIAQQGAYIISHHLNALNPDPDKPKPDMGDDLQRAQDLGLSGDHKKDLTSIVKEVGENNVSLKWKENAIDYTFSGNMPNVFRQIEVDSRGKEGRYSIYSDWSKPKVVAGAVAAGPVAFDKYSNGMKNLYEQGLFKHEISQLGNYQHIGLQVSYDSDNGHVNVDYRPGLSQAAREALRSDLQAAKESLDRLNQGTDGLRNVLKGDGTDPNAYFLGVFSKDENLDIAKTPGIPAAIRDAVMMSHSDKGFFGQDIKPAPTLLNPDQLNGISGGGSKGAPGSSKMAPVVSDAGDQMGMGATAMNKLPEELGPKGETMPAIRPTISGVPKSSPLNKPSNQDSRNFTKTPVEVPPELTAGGANAEYLGRGSNPTREVVPQSPAGPITALQKKLDRTLAKGEKAAKAHLDAVKEHHEDLKKLINDEIMRIQERQHALSEGGTAPASEMNKPEYKAP